MAYRTKLFNYVHTDSANIDAWYGVWNSLAEVYAFAKELGLSEPIEGVVSAVKDSSGVITRYIFYNHEWHKEANGGGGEGSTMCKLKYAEYKALEAEGKIDDTTIYLITDQITDDIDV